MSGILHGAFEIIDRFFDLPPMGKAPHYRHKTSCAYLSIHPLVNQNGKWLIKELYQQIKINWESSRARYGKDPSKENWRFAQCLELANENSSPEITLERAIIRSAEGAWANQVPTSSGLMGPVVDKRRCVDLVQRCSPKKWELIELKVASDTPLFAAIEILNYGLLYLFSRQLRKELGFDRSKEILFASRVDLKVLAPHQYYCPRGSRTLYNLGWLEQLLNDGLRGFLDQNTSEPLRMIFQFETFPENFEWTPTTDTLQDSEVKSAMQRRHAVYPTPS